MQKSSDLEYPPKGIFDDISNSYDYSIVVYFRILGLTFFFMIISTICSIPAIYLCQVGNTIFGTYYFSLETLTLANIQTPQGDTWFIIVVAFDTLIALVFLILPIYLRVSIHYQTYYLSIYPKKNKIPPISQWAVQIRGFPKATIDKDDLAPLFSNYAMHEIQLVRDFNGTLYLHREKVFAERLLRLESLKLKLLSSSLTSEQLFTRQRRIEEIKSFLSSNQVQLADQINILLSPDDLESLSCFAIFKTIKDRDLFYETYNSGFFTNLMKCFKQDPELQLRGIYKIEVDDAYSPCEIMWENIDHQYKFKFHIIIGQFLILLLLLLPSIAMQLFAHKYSRSDPIKCTSQYCLNSDTSIVHFFVMFGSGLGIVVMNEIAIFFLELLIQQEKQPYIVNEQIVIFARSLIFLTLNSIILIIVCDSEIYSINIIYQLTCQLDYFQSFEQTNYKIIYSSDIDRKWLINTGIKLIWVAIGNALANLIKNFIVVLIKRQPGDELDIMDEIMLNDKIVKNDLSLQDQAQNLQLLQQQEEQFKLQQEVENKIEKHKVLNSFFLGALMLQDLGVQREEELEEQSEDHGIRKDQIDLDVSPKNVQKVTNNRRRQSKVYQQDFKSLEETLQTQQIIRHDSLLVNSNSNFVTGKNYAILVTSLSICFIFCGPIPILSFFGVISIGVQYVQDKLLLMNFNSYDSKQGMRLQLQNVRLAIIVLKLFPYILILHILVSIITFGSSTYFPLLNDLGIRQPILNDDQLSFQILYKAQTVLPLSIMLILTFLYIIFESIFSYFYKDQTGMDKIASTGIDNTIEDQLELFLPQMEKADLLTSYNLQKHEKYVDLLKSVKFQSVNAVVQKDDQVIYDQ